MAPKRRRSDAGNLPGGDANDDEERSPKARRLGRSPTHGSVSESTGASSSSTRDHGHDDGNDDLDEHHQVDERGDGEEEGGEEVDGAQRSGRKGKGKRRAKDAESRPPEEDEAEEGNRLVAGGVGGEEPRRANAGAGGAAAGENAGPSLPRSKKGSKEGSLPSSGKEKDGSDSEAGVVLKVYAQNFMCHRKLTVSFCKHMNFISGRNGSGKSAILAALQICLGARAHLTHRAKKMADFIRHGWLGDAVLEVTLYNSKHGFMFGVYGVSVTVRRIIRQNGGSRLELLGHDGTVKSRDKAALFRMLDVFNIQIDNPCAVLDQENSKKFLQGNDKDKYAFFMRATDLDRIFSDVQDTGTEITKMKNGHDQATEEFPRYKADVDKLKAEVKEYQNLQELEKRIFSLKEKIVWAHVNEAEEEAVRLADSYEDMALDIKTLNERMAGYQAALAQFAASKDEIKARLDAGVLETKRLQAEMRKASSDLKSVQAPLVLLRDRRPKLQEDKNDKSEAKKAAAKELKAARQEAMRSASDNQEKALLDKIQRAEDSLAEVARRKEARGGEDSIAGLRTAVQTARDEAESSRKQLDDAKEELAARGAELRSLESGAFDPLTAIGQYMPALVRRITQEARKFRSPPVGPLGAFIQLKEEYKQFRVCIEGHLGRNLSNFVVGCHDDKAALMALVRDFKRNYRGDQRWYLPTIIVQTPQARYSPPQNPPGCLQIMQAINVTNDEAFNSLVDQCYIEKNCLFASKEEAENACLRGNSGRYKHMPHGMFEAYYPSQGGKSCNKFTVSDGNLQTRMNTVNSNRHRRVLGVDQATQRREAQARVEQAVAAVEHVRGTADSEARILITARAALEDEEAERDELEKRQSQLEREKAGLSTELLALRAKESGAADPTEELQRLVEVATEALDDAVEDLAALEKKIVEISATVAPLKDAAYSASKAHKESSEAAARIQDELEEGGVGEAEQHREVNKAEAALDKLNKELEDLSVRKEAAEGKAETLVKKAATVMHNLREQQGEAWDGVRVAVAARANSDFLRSKLAKRKERFEREKEKRNLKSKSLGEVQGQLIEAVERRAAIKELAHKLAGNMKQLSDERLKRLDKWKHMLTHAVKTTSRKFNEYLLVKGASGEVSFDHEDKTMGMTYQKDSSNDASQCDDVRQLSGGERSFATLAMLLALGRANECPFRVMDEFDVFMDAVSRNVAIQQVIDFAALDATRQFILITPQDLSSVIATDTCKIIKMKAPRRGDHNQVTLEEALGTGGAPSS